MEKNLRVNLNPQISLHNNKSLLNTIISCYKYLFQQRIKKNKNTQTIRIPISILRIDIASSLTKEQGMFSQKYTLPTFVTLILILFSSFSSSADLHLLYNQEYTGIAKDISSDGSTVILNSPTPGILKWTQTGGFTYLPDLFYDIASIPHNVSADGSYIIGHTKLPNYDHTWSKVAVLWENNLPRLIDISIDSGPEGISKTGEKFLYTECYGPNRCHNKRFDTTGAAPDFLSYSFQFNIFQLQVIENRENLAIDLNDDGNKALYRVKNNNDETWYSIVFNIDSPSNSKLIGGEAPGVDVFATDLSANGNYVVGYLRYGSDYTTDSAFLWSEATGLISIGENMGVYTRPSAVSNDGKVVIGSYSDGTPYGSNSFIWTPENGIQELKTVLIDKYNLDLSNVKRMGATAISADGNSIIGNITTNTHSDLVGFLVRLVDYPASISITQPITGQKFETGETIKLGSAVNDVEDDEFYLARKVKWFINKELLPQTGDNITLQGLTTGEYVIESEVTDSANNISRSSSITIEILPSPVWRQEFNTDSSGLTLLPQNMAVENGVLSASRMSGWQTYFYESIGERSYFFEEKTTFTAQLTATNAWYAAGELGFGAKNSTEVVGDKRFHSAFMENGGWYVRTNNVYGYDSVIYLGPASLGVTYQIEVELHSNGSSLYIYPLGQQRGDLYEHHKNDTDWTDARLYLYSNQLGLDGYFDNVKEFVPDSIPNSPPSIELVSPTDGLSYVAGEIISCSANVSDNEDDNVVLGSAVKWLINGVARAETGAQISIQDLSPGSYSISARVTDSGGKSTETPAVTITVIPAPNTPPQINITAPANDAFFTVGDPITFTAYATDAEDDDTLLATAVEWKIGGQVRPETGDSVIINNLALGTYQVYAQVTDSNSRQTVSLPIQITVQPAPNNPPHAEILSPFDGDKFLLGEVVDVLAQISDVEDAVADLTIVWTLDGVQRTETSETLTLSNLTPGTHSIKLAVTDLNLDTTTHEISITVSESSTPTETTLWSQNFSVDANGLGVLPEHVTLQNSVLQIQRMSGWNTVPFDIYGERVYPFTNEVLFRAKIKATDSWYSTGEIGFGATNTTDIRSDMRFHTAFMENGRWYIRASTVYGYASVTDLGPAELNTDYQMELVSHNTGTSLYIYPFGQTRGSLYEHHLNFTNWQDIKMHLYTNQLGLNGEIDNLEEVKILH